MSEELERKVNKVLAKAKAAVGGKCPQCGEQDWSKYGLPGENGKGGMWDWECNCCGYMQGHSPYSNQSK